MKDSWHGFAELLPDESAKGVRRPDPPRPTDLARERAVDRGATVLDLINSMVARMTAWREREKAQSLPKPPPEAAPLPPGAPPPPKLQWNGKTKQWEIPCTLSREQLASTVPSKELARRMRAAMEQKEKAERKLEARKYLF
jgi:hypothetical protein